MRLHTMTDYWKRVFADSRRTDDPSVTNLGRLRSLREALNQEAQSTRSMIEDLRETHPVITNAGQARLKSLAQDIDDIVQIRGEVERTISYCEAAEE